MDNFRHIPEIGEAAGNAIPGPMRLAHATVGAATTNDVVVGDTKTYVLWQVDSPIVVVHIWTQVETAFTASVTLDIGDTGDLDRYSVSGTVVPQSTGGIFVVDTYTTIPYKTSDDITVDVNAATVAAGVLSVYIQYAVLND